MNIRASIIAVVLALGVAGCSQSGDGLTQQQKDAGDRNVQIMKRTKGDWNAMTSDEKQFMISQSGGDERAARAAFDMMSHRGAPPTPGPGSTAPGRPPGK